MPAITSSSFPLRRLKDRLARLLIAIGGLAVVAAILLIFVYLLYVIWPLFAAPSHQQIARYNAPESTQKSLELQLEAKGQQGFRILADGRLLFFDTQDGQLLDILALPQQQQERIRSFALPNPDSAYRAVGSDNGRLLLFRPDFTIDYPHDQRRVQAAISYPFGEQWLDIDPQQQALQHIAIAVTPDQAHILAFTADQRLLFTQLDLIPSLLDEDSLEIAARQDFVLDALPPLQGLLLNAVSQQAYLLLQDGKLRSYRIQADGLQLHEQLDLRPDSQAKADHMRFLLGRQSLLIGDDQGVTNRWFAVRDAGQEPYLRAFGNFHSDSTAAISVLATESQRRVFASGNDQGKVALYHATTDKLLWQHQASTQAIRQLVLSANGEYLLLEDDAGTMQLLALDNPHPELSWSVLWSKIWYESYPEPSYIWQSSAASNDFEPKFSFVPLTFGTLKAAFYAMLLAIPLAVLGAIFTAQFMHSRMRQWVKPTIEVMEALPTVIIGFLAGLWLAPFIESHLLAILLMPLAMVLSILLTAWSINHLRADYLRRLDGWESLLLLPVLLAIGSGFLHLSPLLEEFFFAGHLPSWLFSKWGISYDQRNALVVGLAIGFAIIPTIFSISEDALYSVPRHLINGSMALGATNWQTLRHVILPAASPAIFSAIMMGLGRAVGETMIVLMATGNTPLIEFDLFQGMRTLSANIAVEMPESEVGSSHYRVLFLAALLLFGITFFFNLLADMIRQRLRARYRAL